MSKSSCSSFSLANYDVDIIARKNAIDIRLRSKPITFNGHDSGTVLVTDGNGNIITSSLPSVDSDHITLNTDNGNITASFHHIASGYVTTGNNGYILSNISDGQGGLRPGWVSATTYDNGPQNFRLFFKNGYLKCASTWPIYKRCHAINICDYIYNSECRVKIEEHLLLLAKRKGIEVPDKFKQMNPAWNSEKTFALLDWLSYPLIREIDGLTVCKNLTYYERDLISPNFEVLNFRNLIQHYFGTVTSKLLEEIWKVIVVGEDYLKTPIYKINAGTNILISNPFDNTTSVTTDNEVTVIGNKCINIDVLTLGLAIFRVMGFDYFYQSLPYFTKKINNLPYTNWTHSVSVQRPVNNLTFLSKFISNKKLLNIVCSAEWNNSSTEMTDAIRMLQEYENPEKIPKSLKSQYPNGLTVDFKFKTIKELHDKISTQYTILKAEANKKEIAVAEVYGKLDGKEKDGLKLIVPRDTTTLSLWGKTLNNCIASYGDRAARGDTLLLGVEKEGTITYGIEFRSIIIPKLLPSDASAQIVNPTDAFRIDYGPQYTRELYPRLVKRANTELEMMNVRHPSELSISYVPTFVQFKGNRNCEPDQKDSIAVYDMLEEWVKENWEFLKDIKGIFEESVGTFYGFTNNQNGDYLYQANYQFQDIGGALNQEAIENGAQAIRNQNGQPQQMVVNPATAEALRHHIPFNNYNYVIQNIGLQ